jgi:RNA-binding protein
MKTNLSSAKNIDLRKKAYSLKPYVMIGQHGLTDAVLAEIDLALNAHELIKIRIRGADKNERSLQCLKIQQELNATIIHQVGFITVIYRPKADISEVQ